MRARSTIIWLAGLAVLAAVHVTVDSRVRMLDQEHAVSKNAVWLPSSAFSMMATGQTPLMADFLWIGAIQFLGKTLAHHSHELVDGEVVCHGVPAEEVESATGEFYALVERITDVDPQFIYVYYLSALFLNDPHADPELALRLLQKGVQNNTGSWNLRFWYALLTLLIHRDRETARSELEIAASLEGCPAYVDHIRQRLHTASDRDLTEIFLKASLIQAKSDLERQRILQKLGELDAGVDIRQILELRESLHEHGHAHTHDHTHDHDRD